MNLDIRLALWWDGLTDAQRSQAMAIIDEVPLWMVASLDASGIPMVEAIVREQHVALVPTRVREFIERQHQSES